MRYTALALIALLLLFAPVAVAKVDLAVVHDDPEGDVIVDGEAADRPDGDLVRVATEVDGEDIVTTIRAAADIPDNAALQFEAYFMEEDFFQDKIIIDVEQAGLVEVEGRRTKDFAPAETFSVQVTRDGATMTLRWPSSAVPAEAECFDFVATLHTPRSGADGRDHAGWDITKASSCAPKAGSGKSGSEESPGLAMPFVVVALAALVIGIKRRH